MIDQAKGMLIFLYGMDDQTAFDTLRRHSQNTNIKLRALAEQLVSDYRALSNGEALPSRVVYDETLMTVHERITLDRTNSLRARASRTQRHPPIPFWWGFQLTAE